ncbi:DNAJ1 [Symbiodinium pilosum]|uniref:DNAJ1 protein n=1 Tax=Symbiodinium pilosum TaxID=2952 RepID=A0A812SJQ1_SYMPI|nr:DNAJ1 [Symbiodinium pilosum]
MGVDSNQSARSGYAAQGQNADRSSTFSWKKSGTDQNTPQKGLSFGGSLKPQPARQSGSSQPDHDTCEQAISAMVSRSYNGMKEALQLLGLPDYPLSFVPGRELKLCGHQLREEINEMIHHWMTDEKDDFYSALSKIKGIVAKPILTEEELDLLDSKEEWQKTLGPDGGVMFTRRQDGPQPPLEDDDDDDEVIDVTPDGTRLSSSAKTSGMAARNAQSKMAEQAGTGLQEQDYYALLGVNRKASLQEIRTRFRALVLTAHPEKGGDPDTFHKLNKAYSVLSDPAKRQEYDAESSGR